MLKDHKWELALMGGFLLLTLLFYTGCGQKGSPTAPEVPRLPQSGIRILRLGGADSVGVVCKGEPLYAEEFIEADVGGEVELEGEYVDHEVEVPAGALSEDTLISVACPDAQLAVVNFGPCGISFNVPVSVSLYWRDVEDVGGDLGIYWYDEEQGKWVEILARIEVIGNDVDAEFELNHFSRYALAD